MEVVLHCKRTFAIFLFFFLIHSLAPILCADTDTCSHISWRPRASSSTIDRHRKETKADCSVFSIQDLPTRQLRRSDNELQTLVNFLL